MMAHLLAQQQETGRQTPEGEDRNCGKGKYNVSGLDNDLTLEEFDCVVVLGLSTI